MAGLSLHFLRMSEGPFSMTLANWLESTGELQVNRLNFLYNWALDSKYYILKFEVNVQRDKNQYSND